MATARNARPKAKRVPSTDGPTPAVGYLRVSKMGSRQVDDDATQTLKIQRKRCEALAAAKGFRIVAWFQDLDASGGNTDRAQFQLAMAAIEAGDASVFCCAYLDRFSRSVDDTIQQERRIRDAGGSLVVGDADIDTSTPMGRGMFQIMAVMNEIFLAVKTEQFDDHRASAVARGIAPSRPPLGYRKNDDTRRYEIVEAQAAIVRLAFQLRAAGVVCPEIARQLNVAGYTTAKGSRWTDRAVRNLLAVKSYCGDVVDGDYVFRDAHPAIVDRATWQKAQIVTPSHARQSVNALLSGSVRCASCCHSMVVNGDYYTCRGNHSSGRCPAPASIRLDVLDAFVEADFLATADRHLTSFVGVEAAGDADVEQAIADAQVELDTFYAGASIAAMGADRYNAEAGRRQVALDRAIQARTMTQRSAVPHVGYRSVAAVWGDLDTPEKRDVFHFMLDGVFVNPAPRSHGSADPASRVHVAPSGTVPFDLPRRGFQVVQRPFAFPVDGAPDPAGVLAA